MKTCSKCGESKPETEFHGRPERPNGLRGRCKACERERVCEKSRRYREANPEKNRERLRRYREANPEKTRERLRRWYDANAENAREYARRYAEAHPEKVRERNRRYREENPEKNREYARRYSTRRCQTDPAYRAAKIFRARFYAWFKARGLKKDRRVLAAVGCTLGELRQHIEAQFQPGMTWDNWALDGWHIDHIVPLATAGDDVEAMFQLWHHTNLQPLWAADNLSKAARVETETQP